MGKTNCNYFEVAAGGLDWLTCPFCGKPATLRGPRRADCEHLSKFVTPPSGSHIFDSFELIVEGDPDGDYQVAHITGDCGTSVRVTYRGKTLPRYDLGLIQTADGRIGEFLDNIASEFSLHLITGNPCTGWGELSPAIELEIYKFDDKFGNLGTIVDSIKSCATRANLPQPPLRLDIHWAGRGYKYDTLDCKVFACDKVAKDTGWNDKNRLSVRREGRRVWQFEEMFVSDGSHKTLVVTDYKRYETVDDAVRAYEMH